MKHCLLLLALAFPTSLMAQATKTDLANKSAKSNDRKNVLGVKIPGYQHKKIEGFDVLINDSVFKHNDDSEWKRKPLDVLELELSTVSRVLPKKVESVLKSIIVWVEWQDQDDPDFGKAVAKYYGLFGGNLAGWSLSNNKHPGKANNVEVIDMKSLTKEHQPDQKFERCVLLHEFAHAVHFHIVGSNNAIVTQTYNHAMSRKLYDSAKDVNGRTIKPYASSNDHEYFAELTCCYINKLHYFPNTREDLKTHDKDGYAMMEKVWGKADKLDATIKAEQDKAAMDRLAKAKSLALNQKKSEAIALVKKIVDYFPKSSSAKEAKILLEKWEAE